MTKVIYRRLIELVLLFLVCLIPVSQVVNGNVFKAMSFAFSIIVILIILPFMVFIELLTLLTKRFSTTIRALLSLFSHIAALALGSFVLFFLGAVIQEYASNEIFSEAADAFVNILPYAIGFWGVDEALRFLFREPGSAVQWKSKSNGV